MSPDFKTPIEAPLVVEFYGTARLSMGRSDWKTDSTLPKPRTLFDLLESIEHETGKRHHLIRESLLVDGLIVNLDGHRFTRKLDTSLDHVQSVLIMSVDVGG